MWREFLEAIGIYTMDFIDDGCRRTWAIAYGERPLQWLFWALFGNDNNGQEEGGCGFLTSWLRNPCYNLAKCAPKSGYGKLFVSFSCVLAFVILFGALCPAYLVWRCYRWLNEICTGK